MKISALASLPFVLFLLFSGCEKGEEIDKPCDEDKKIKKADLFEKNEGVVNHMQGDVSNRSFFWEINVADVCPKANLIDAFAQIQIRKDLDSLIKPSFLMSYISNGTMHFYYPTFKKESLSETLWSYTAEETEYPLCSDCGKENPIGYQLRLMVKIGGSDDPTNIVANGVPYVSIQSEYNAYDN
jgi:hypothetical protein